MARVLILGANSTIAGEVAKRCAARGDRLFLIGRDPTKLDARAAELGASVVGMFAADLTETARNEERVLRAREALGGLDLVLIAHGVLGDRLETERSVAAAEAIIAANFTSAVSLLIPVANLLEQQGHGTVAVITSVAGDRGRPRNYTYGASKGALNLYLQGVRSRLHRKGIKVVAVRLGPVDTPMTIDHPKNPLFVQPDRVAETLLRALEGRRQDFYLPWYWSPIMAVVRHLPEAVFQRIGFLSGR